MGDLPNIIIAEMDSVDAQTGKVYPPTTVVLDRVDDGYRPRYPIQNKYIPAGTMVRHASMRIIAPKGISAARIKIIR